MPLGWWPRRGSRYRVASRVLVLASSACAAVCVDEVELVGRGSVYPDVASKIAMRAPATAYLFHSLLTRHPALLSRVATMNDSVVSPNNGHRDSEAIDRRQNTDASRSPPCTGFCKDCLLCLVVMTRNSTSVASRILKAILAFPEQDLSRFARVARSAQERIHSIGG